MIWPFLHALRIVTVFGLLSMFTRKRATHGRGIGARGTLKVVDAPTFPKHDFFRAGRVFPVRLRHANVQIDDDAGLDVRGAALKFSDEDADSPFDLPMNTGKASIFNDAIVFWHLVRAELLYGIFRAHWPIERFYRRYPKGYRAEQGSVRRAPSSFADLYYYSKLVLAFRGEDDELRGVKYRLIPASGAIETGLPDDADRQHPWVQERHDDVDLPRDYLRSELRERLLRSPIEYRLQLQLHDLPADASVLDSSIPWDEKEHPWMDLATVTIEECLNDIQTDQLRFSLANHPPSLGTLPAKSPSDFNAVADLRKRVYDWIQRFRFFLPRSKRVTSTPGKTLTLLTYVKPEALCALRTLLEDTRLPNLPNVHFARWALIEASNQDNSSYAPQLLYAVVFDGNTDTHLQSLVDHAESTLRDLYTHCLSTPSAGKNSLIAFLHQQLISPKVVYRGAVGHSTHRIQQENRLYERVQEFVDRRRKSWLNSQPEVIREEIRKFARTHTDLPVDIVNKPGLFARLGHASSYVLRITIVAAPFLVLAAGLSGTIPLPTWLAIPLLTGVLLVIVVGAWLIAVRWLERCDTVESDTCSEDHLHRLIDEEDRGVQNAITLSIEIKPGWIRWVTLRAVLWGANFLTHYRFTHGNLAGINTIHFARVYLINGGHRLLFLSDYDGSWEQYLEDFLTIGSNAVVPIWTNLRGCPRTRFLFTPEPGFARIFKPYIRHHQSTTNVWYGAYSHLTVPNILHNSQIRAGLFSKLDDKEEMQWLTQL